MELSEKYVYKVYEKRSFSLAASELFVSQPALSSMISRLEASLGFKIFDRSTNPISLTPKGRIYIDYLEEALQMEYDFRLKLDRIDSLGGSSISIGALCHSSYIILPPVCAEFSKRHPGTEITVNSGNARNFGSVTAAIKKHKLDLILTYRSDDPDLMSIPVINERLVIAINKNTNGSSDLLPLTFTRTEVLKGEFTKDKLITDFSVLKSLPIFTFSTVGNTFNRLISKFDKGYIPSKCNIKNAEHLAMHYEMLRCGIASVITSDIHIAHELFPEDEILYLVPECPEVYRTLNLIKRKNNEDDPLIDSFVDIVKDFCSKIRIT